MENKIKFSEVKKVYTGNADEVQRGFFAMLKRLQKDAAAAEAQKRAEVAALAVADAVKAEAEAVQHNKEVKGSSAPAETKAEAQKAAEAAKQRTSEARKAAQAAGKEAQKAREVCTKDGITPESVQALAEVMQRKRVKLEDITKDFLILYLPERFNAEQQICSVKEVKPEDAAEVRKQYADNSRALVQRDEKLFIYKPISLFTANSFLSLFTSAADKRAKLEKEAADKRSAAEKEADKKKKAEARARKFEEMRKALAKYDAEMEAAQK